MVSIATSSAFATPATLVVWSGLLRRLMAPLTQLLRIIRIPLRIWPRSFYDVGGGAGRAALGLDGLGEVLAINMILRISKNEDVVVFQIGSRCLRSFGHDRRPAVAAVLVLYWEHGLVLILLPRHIYKFQTKNNNFMIQNI